ncbi:glyoxylate/hydroxypyruvate reductase A isoform X1 [Diabrotica virgifera virgifera]|uniref:Uncharacterized protein LOC114331199 isoform X1 n=1 Tax=Diabrotica virgifera virgifera TaxID=50390 RepID=A0A6P7FK32_DIAVI|nr:glyoxylate/hydroxypyruvate reductase A isoform X1 [Diabrotica virgifera virgifera]
MHSVISVLSRIKNIVPELQNALPNLTFHEVSNAELDKQFKESHIIVADYDLLTPHMYSLPQAKWVQGTWAGVNDLMAKVTQPPPFSLSRFTGRHFGALMSEYVVANIINFERNAFETHQNQKMKQWIVDGKIEEHRAIFDLTVGILGLGNIGDRVARTLNYMGAVVFGYGRRPHLNLEDNPHISKYFSNQMLPQLLRECDYVVNTLPETQESKWLLNGDILENCKDKQAVFINVGRGTIISEEALIKALENKWISGAILDVFEQEPLPTESALWQMPNVIITPHVSACSRAKDIAQQLKDNLEYYRQHLPIPATVDFSKGY